MKDKKHMTEIFEYIRRRYHGKVYKTGIILGVVNDNVVKIGWSKCNLKCDKFDVTLGLQMAINRAMAKESAPTAPNCIRRQLRGFGARCVRYFKDANKIELPA